MKVKALGNVIVDGRVRLNGEAFEVSADRAQTLVEAKLVEKAEADKKAPEPKKDAKAKK